MPVDEPYNSAHAEKIKDLLNSPTLDEVVIDARKSGKTGGTGQLLPLVELKKDLEDLSSKCSIAGGLKPENVADAVKTFHPKGVDASSGLESIPGQKDSEKVKAFFENLHLSPLAQC